MRQHLHDLKLGTSRDASRSTILPASARDKHLYIAGATGTGKSKLLEHLVRQDILDARVSGRGVLLMDPHGALYDDLLAWMTFANLNRPLVLVDMREADWVVSYNVLRRRELANPSVVVDNFVQAMAYVWGQDGTDQTPLFNRWAGNTLRVLYERGYTLSDAVHLLGERADVRAAMACDVSEPGTRVDWERANSNSKSTEFEDRVGSTVSRIRRFLCNDVLRCMFGQPTASLDLGWALEAGAIVLVSLAREKGRVSKEDAETFATLLLTDLWTAAQERGKKRGVKPFYVYLDEFQRFMSPTIAENLDEARGFGLHLTLAHQFPKQLSGAGERGKRLYDSVMENTSSKVVFRLTDPENLDPLAKWLFMGVMNPDEIKHRVFATKVVGYTEETRTTRSEGRTVSSSRAMQSSTSAGDSTGGSEALDLEGELLGTSRFSGGHLSETSGTTTSHGEACTTSESESSVLLPVMGQELSNVQFRSIEEQVHRAAAALFSQDERVFTARLAGMKAPVTLRTVDAETPLVNARRISEYVARQMQNLPFALAADEAMRRLKAREAHFADELLQNRAASESTTSRRRAR